MEDASFFNETIKYTAEWYKNFYKHKPEIITVKQIKDYFKNEYRSMRIQFTKKINKILRHLGFELSRYYPEMRQKTFDEIYKEILEKNLVIFDVGANQGQSISRFDKLFNL